MKRISSVLTVLAAPVLVVGYYGAVTVLRCFVRESV